VADPIPAMLTITTPSANATVKGTFIVAGTCNVNHAVTVRVTQEGTGAFREQTATPVSGKWETTFYSWTASKNTITATCGNMIAPVELDGVAVE